MKIILIRHAQKGIQPIDDPELDQKGKIQALSLLKQIQLGHLPHPTHSSVSLKIRTMQTLLPMIEFYKISTTQSNLLQSKGSNQTLAQYREQITKWIQSIQSENEDVHYVCTHFDWIEEAMSLIPCDRDLNTFEFAHWSPAQYIVFEIHEGLWKFKAKGHINNETLK